MAGVELRTICRKEWRSEREDYRNRVEPFVTARRERRSRGVKHPVEDFIWEYYALRGGRLLAWSPGARRILEGATELEFPEREGYRTEEDGRVLDVGAVLARRGSGVRWIRNLLEATASRPPVFHCLGLHEWAMVYEDKDIRHDVPLRLSHAETRRVVETLPVRCTHYDAFRFFSASARPLNQDSLTAEGRSGQEQPGCLHVNMDLFKWCMKLRPLVPSALTADCFDLACRARETDMRASPYDLRDYGFEPIPIETPGGRAEYVRAQREIAEAAIPLRGRLIELLDGLAGEEPDVKLI